MKADAELTPRGLARRFGAHVEINATWYGVAVQVDAPDGMLWACDDLHTLAANGDSASDPHMWADLRDRMLYGLRPCPDDCDCHDPFSGARPGWGEVTLAPTLSAVYRPVPGAGRRGEIRRPDVDAGAYRAVAFDAYAVLLGEGVFDSAIAAAAWVETRTRPPHDVNVG